MSESAEADGLLEALRDRVLRRLLTVYGFGAVAIGGLFALRALQAGASSPRMWAMLAASQSVWVLRILHGRLGFRRTALAFLGYLWLLPAVLQTYRGLTPGAALSYVALLMLAGLFFGRRGALLGFAVSLVTQLASGMFIALHLVRPSPAALWDPLDPLVWLRYALTFALFGGALTLVFSDVITTLHESARKLHETLARERAERQRREAAQAGLERAKQLEGLAHLAGGMAHDFNNSLSIIMSGLELIHADNTNPGPTRKLAGEVADAAELAAQSVQQLLSLGRRDGGRPERVCAASLLERSRPSLQRMLPDDTLLELQLASRSDVRIDVGRLTQAVVNLALNARDAMAGHGGRLVLRVDECERAEVPSGAFVRPGRFVRLSCIDTGTGMDEATLQRVFEPFFTTKLEGKGTGLGLAMVQATVREAGGFVEVVSKLGQGTEFAIYLPVFARPLVAPERTQVARA